MLFDFDLSEAEKYHRSMGADVTVIITHCDGAVSYTHLRRAVSALNPKMKILRKKAMSLPLLPGVYIMKNADA